MALFDWEWFQPVCLNGEFVTAANGLMANLKLTKEKFFEKWAYLNKRACFLIWLCYSRKRVGHKCAGR